MNETNRYAPPKAQVADVVGSDQAPPLWNPNAAANWCLLFSPIFGAILQMKNWQALGEDDRAASSKRWAIGCGIATFLAMLMGAYSATTPNSNNGTSSYGIVILIVWYIANGRAQGKYVKERFGKDYPRRGWGMPILIAIGVFACVVFVAVIVGFVIGAANGYA